MKLLYLLLNVQSLKVIVYSDTQRRNSLVDAHLEVAVRQGKPFVDDTTLNVTMPGDLFTSL